MEDKVINYFLTYNKIKGCKYWKICFKDKNKTMTKKYLGNADKILKDYKKLEVNINGNGSD